MDYTSLQVENGNFTRIINPVIDALVKIPFRGCELACAIFIIRKTWGFNKKEDAISLSQFESGVCRTRSVVVKSIKNLELLNIVAKTSKPYQTTIYRVNKYIDTWKAVGRSGLIKHKSGTSLGTYTSIGTYTKSSLGTYTRTSLGTYTHKRQLKTKDISEATASQGLSIKGNKMKNNSFGKYNEKEHQDGFEDVIDYESREYVQKKTQTKKYPNARLVFALWGKYPANWKINKTQLLAAENLYSERGLERIAKALNFYKQHQGDKFCPEISSPYDLDSKWQKLLAFKKKI